ncbi:uncharacterized protein FOMMEDRAFT_152366 [Fomitiporia mediterranea MF3/22]|uniref:uncharacterized protein n=1 Tax=Fomitiporia mediterranea (strain MF3/22) TaxID=694068 RepID=UPI00044078A1|nr:uncharacterized protein FOMMEDRAFT_152366 [Fomitiporia mediterranea MF3/22]EJD07025.1 hypothetical protein FOMMEDRAFT_152366 [Fomitiporia mediterranea MF3/22]
MFSPPTLLSSDNAYSLMAERIFSDVYYVRLTRVAILAATIYEIVITMGDEITYFFESHKRISLEEVLINLPFFRWNRLPHGIQRTWDIKSTSIHLDILYLRIRSLFSLNVYDKKRAKYVKSLLVFEIAATFGILLYLSIVAGKTHIQEYPGGLTLCSESLTLYPVITTVYWGIIFIYQILAASLAFYQSIQLHNTLGVRGTSLVKVIIQDQGTYVFLVLICTGANLVGTLWQSPRTVAPDVGTPEANSGEGLP